MNPAEKDVDWVSYKMNKESDFTKTTVKGNAISLPANPLPATNLRQNVDMVFDTVGTREFCAPANPYPIASGLKCCPTARDKDHVSLDYKATDCYDDDGVDSTTQLFTDPRFWMTY